jgi:hypothetical protein
MVVCSCQKIEILNPKHFRPLKKRFKKEKKGGMEPQNLFTTEPASLREQIIRQTSTPQLQEWLIFTTETNQYDLSQMIRREINGRQALLAQNAPRGTNRKNLFGKGLEGGESLGFLGNIKRAFESTWNKPATEQEKQYLAPVFKGEKFLTDYLVKPINPQLGYVGDKQREYLENKYLNGGKRFL